MDREDRGVSTVLGLTLLFAVVLSGMVVVVSFGSAALDQTRDGLDTGRAEKAMTQFDSRSAMVVLGSTDSQGVDLARGTNAQYGVDSRSGWMNVTVYNETADEHKELVNATLGSLAYENSEGAIAYQGGGVWQETEAGTRMLSPPEFHFRSATLTLPIITVNGSGTVDGSATVRRARPTSVRYPNATTDENFTNPLEDGIVNVTVQSKYYEAWGAYFAERTEGEVFYNHTAETARVRLVVPFREDFEDVVATTADGGITVNGNDPQPSPSTTGVDYLSADDRIEDQIEECEDNPATCDGPPFTGIDATGTPRYFVDGSYSGDVDVDTSEGNVTLVVDGDFEPSSVSVSGDNTTQVLVRGDVDGSNGETTNVAAAFAVVVHSTGDFAMNGNSEFTGFLYAPESTCDLNGNAYVVGGTVCETIDINGNPNDMTYDPSIEDLDLNLEGDVTRVTYLHVTVNSVNVTSR